MCEQTPPVSNSEGAREDVEEKRKTGNERLEREQKEKKRKKRECGLERFY